MSQALPPNKAVRRPPHLQGLQATLHAHTQSEAGRRAMRKFNTFVVGRFCRCFTPYLLPGDAAQ
jgi:hypothetical protein